MKSFLSQNQKALLVEKRFGSDIRSSIFEVSITMESPFFRSHWNQPSRPHYSPPSVRGIPVRQPVQRKDSTARSTASPKVVSIPVHFVGSETTRSASALKIQKLFRGYLVRRSIKRIASIRREVEEVERKISQSETVELIRRDAKERLRLNETLMALLFKLDSVRGVDFAVRDCRKAVIRKAIALQERVDVIAAGNLTVKIDEEEDEADVFAQEVDQTLEIKDSGENQTLEIDSVQASDKDTIDDNPTEEIKPSAEVSVEGDNGANQMLTLQGQAPDVKGVADVANNRDFSVEDVDESEEVHSPDAGGHAYGEVEAVCRTEDIFVEDTPEIGEKIDITEVRVDSEVKANEEACAVKQIVEYQNAGLPVSGFLEENESAETSTTVFSANPQILVEEGDENTSKEREDAMKIDGVQSMEEDFKDCVGAGGKDNDRRSTELLERMMEDNEKMMSLMTQLVQKNEMHTRILNSLTQRVEQLERAFVCDRLRRKKKRHNCTMEGSESSPEQNKCGKR